MNEVRAQVIEVGLTADQFQRVILLPQGDFEQFLTARATIAGRSSASSSAAASSTGP